MTGRELAGVRVLILEDDFYLATDLSEALAAHGAVILGPYENIAKALKAAELDAPDVALIDVNLGHGPSFDLPRYLIARGTPFAFVTGYDQGTILTEFSEVLRIEKPADDQAVVSAVRAILAPAGSST